MKKLTVLLTIGLSFFLVSAAFPQISQSDAEYSKETQMLLKKYGGFSKNSARKTPIEYLASDRRLLDIFEKAETFDSRYFKDDYRPLYEKYKGLVAKEGVLVNNYYYWLEKYRKTSVSLQASLCKKFYNNVLKRGNHNKKKIAAATQELNKFYNTALIPVLDSTLTSFGKFWFQEKCRCTEQGIIWEKIVYY